MTRIYDSIFARFYDRALRDVEASGLGDIRRGLLGRAEGRTLEVGAGTGVNLPYYSGGHTRLVLTDPSPPMMRRLEQKMARLRIDAEVVHAAAEHLPFERESFDTVVATLVLCTAEDPTAAVREIRRLLAPDGRLLLVEHVRSRDPALARWQDRLVTPWRWIANGCHCNRDTRALLEAEGFRTADLGETELRGLGPLVRPAICGAVTREP
jgi:ubiquinone/menaquinone biosynthesis C-methylase UbiE